MQTADKPVTVVLRGLSGTNRKRSENADRHHRPLQRGHTTIRDMVEEKVAIAGTATAPIIIEEEETTDTARKKART